MNKLPIVDQFTTVAFDAQNTAVYNEIQKGFVALAQMIENSISFDSAAKSTALSNLHTSYMWSGVALKTAQIQAASGSVRTAA